MRPGSRRTTRTPRKIDGWPGAGAPPFAPIRDSDRPPADRVAHGVAGTGKTRHRPTFQPIGVGYIPRHSSIRVSAARCLRFRFARAARIDSRCRHGRQCRRSTLSRCRPHLEHIPDSARATSRARRCADTRARPAAVLCVFLSRSHCDRRQRAHRFRSVRSRIWPQRVHRPIASSRPACVIVRQSPAPVRWAHRPSQVTRSPETTRRHPLAWGTRTRDPVARSPRLLVPR